MEQTARPQARPHSWRARLVGAWDSVQVELHGCYSVGRMRAFQAYAHNTTHTRTWLVLVLTPLPCLVAVAFADCIPLAPPELGIEHSGGFWIRACFATWVYSYSVMEQLRYFIRELPINGWSTLALSIPVMGLTILCTFLLASTVGYPMPFTIPIVSIPWVVFMAGALWLRLRTHFRENPDKRKFLIHFVCVVLCQMSLLVIYPAYNAVFYNLSSTSQVLFALLLPIIKLVEKNCISLFLRHVEDLKPEQVIFNVEIFNALFIACCMQNSNSLATNFVLVGVDFTMACISLRDLDAILDEVHALANKMQVDPSQLQETVLALCHQYPQLETQATQNDLLERIRQTHSWSRSQSHAECACARPAQPSFLLFVAKNGPAFFQYGSLRSSSSKSAIYLIVLFHLPNRTFYPQLRDMDEMDLYRTIRNVMLNAVFEFVSLLLLVRVLRKKLHISPLRQLAFVLDRQWRMVQSKVVLWVVVTLQSTLYHLGADYSFQFAWLHESQTSRPSPPHRW